MSEWIAVTGAAGYIGSVIAKHCKQRGFKVLGVDKAWGRSPPMRREEVSPYIDQYLGCGYEDVDFAVMCAHHKISKIFHLGGSASVPLSSQIPFFFYHNNAGNTAKMLHHLIENGWHERNGVLLYSSTSSVYEENDEHKTEDYPIGSPNPYGRSKYTTETILEELFNLYKIPTVIFRYFCVAGALEDVGQPLHYPHIIPRIMDAAYTGEPLTIFGADWPTEDGFSIRDFISVNDICRAHFHAAEYAQANPGVHRFNMGTKNGISILSLIKRFEELHKIDVPYIIGERRIGDPAILLCNPDKFIEQTGFDYADSLDEMLISAWDYYCKMKEKTNAV